MEPIDIIYTPLDIPPIPKEFDLEKFKEWCKEVYPQKIYDHVPVTKIIGKHVGDDYLWDLVWPRHNMYGGWMNKFEKKFPEMSNYFSNAFGLDPIDIGTLTVLPLRTDIQGFGFWHVDSDVTGLRIYIENEHPDENPLLFRLSKIPYTDIRSGKDWISKDMYDKNPLFDDEILVGKILHANQGYYINNIRALHSPYITKKSKRIACIIGPNPNRINLIQKKIKNLIVNSAEKYKDHALIWKQK